MFNPLKNRVLAANLFCVLTVCISGTFLFPITLPHLIGLQAVLFPTTNYSLWVLYSGKAAVNDPNRPKIIRLFLVLGLGGCFFACFLRSYFYPSKPFKKHTPHG